MNDDRNPDSDFDAMLGRKLAARWVLTATLRTQTAAHFGGQGQSALDMPILRCGRTNRPLLPGSTLGGALRACLLDRLAGYGIEPKLKPSGSGEDAGLEQQVDGACLDENIDRDRVSRVFGGSRGDDEGSQSPLVVFDALGEFSSESPGTEVRDGVMIETATGTAAEHKKFDFEIVPPGTTFAVRFDLLVPQGEYEAELLSLLAAALDGLDSGDTRIGLRRSRGLGAVETRNWTTSRYDLTTRDGWLGWIASAHELTPDLSSNRSVRDAIETELPDGATLRDKDDKRQRILVDVRARVSGQLLIRSPNREAAGPDVMHLTSGDEPVLSGTSLTGTIRARALKIAQLVHGLSRKDAESRWITPLFGTREEGITNPNFKPRGSRLRVAERTVANGHTHNVTRLAIDRFTQGVVPAALFEEQPHDGGTVDLHFEIRNPCPGEVGLLLLVLKDLLTGRLPVGGTSSVGRGVLVGRRVTVHGSAVAENIDLELDDAQMRGGKVPGNEQINNLVAEFVSLQPDSYDNEGATE